MNNNAGSLDASEDQHRLSSVFLKMKNFGRNARILAYVTVSIAYYCALAAYNHEREKTDANVFIPISQGIWGAFAELSVVGAVYIPSLIFDVCTQKPSTKINPILMTVPAAISLLRDITFYASLGMVVSAP